MKWAHNADVSLKTVTLPILTSHYKFDGSEWYTTTTVLGLLQEVVQVQDVKIDWNLLAESTNKQFSRRRAEAYGLQQSYRCTKVGWRTDCTVKVSSSSVRLLEGVGSSVGDVSKPACSLYDCSFTETTSMNNVSVVDVSSLDGWVPDVTVIGLLALLMRSERVLVYLFCGDR
ncbi:hypothetical protein Tco_1046125 [Tanacetum coccineum]